MLIRPNIKSKLSNSQKKNPLQIILIPTNYKIAKLPMFFHINEVCVDRIGVITMQ